MYCHHLHEVQTATGTWITLANISGRPLSLHNKSLKLNREQFTLLKFGRVWFSKLSAGHWQQVSFAPAHLTKYRFSQTCQERPGKLISHYNRTHFVTTSKFEFDKRSCARLHHTRPWTRGSCSNETGCPIFLNNWWFLPSWVITKNSVMLICSQGCVTQEGKPSTTWCDWLVLLAFFPLQTQKSPVNKASRLRTLETHFRGNTMMETRLRRTSSASASQLLLHLTNINSTLQRGRPPSCKCRARHKTPRKVLLNSVSKQKLV